MVSPGESQLAWHARDYILFRKTLESITVIDDCQIFAMEPRYNACVEMYEEFVLRIFYYITGHAVHDRGI